LLVADRRGRRVVRREPDGTLGTVAGTGHGGYAGDGGPAVDAWLGFPSAITVDPEGRLFVADTSNHVVRMVDGAGRIWTVAGTGQRGASPDGSAEGARLTAPISLAWANGGLLFAEDRQVRWIGPIP
jgi:hypothetical protein